jgi:hypothetical protein
MKDKETPYVSGILNRYVGKGEVGEYAHILYKEEFSRDLRELPIKEFLLADGTVSDSMKISYCGFDNSVRTELAKGFIYLGIGVLHK